MEHDIEELKVRLHREYLDPMWQSAAKYYTQRLERRPWLLPHIKRKARGRVYEWLSFKMRRSNLHVRLLDKADCLEAMNLLDGVDYATILEWCKANDRRRKHTGE